MRQHQLRSRPSAIVGGRGVAGGLAALVALALLVVAPPLALVTFVGNPIPEQALVGDRLTDEAVIGMLAAVVWIAWAQVLFVVLVEAGAAIRGAALPRPIPMCGPQQQLARRLVLAVVFLLAGTATASGAYADTAAAAPAAAQPAAVALLGPTSPVAVGATSIAPLQSAADQTPGFSERRDHDDRVRARAAGHWYTVQPPDGRNHDTLWDIAERHLGDGRRWKEIFELNRNRPQADGERLEVARLIYPGWRLLLPADAVGLPPAENEQAVREQAQPPRSADQMNAAPSAPEAEDATLPASAVGDSQAFAASGEQRAAAIPTPRAAEYSASSENIDVVADRLDESDEPPVIPFGALTLGFSAVAAAGLTAELARRRRRAQRFRPPGARLRRPTSTQDLAERQLRTANAEISVTVLRDALRALAEGCHAAQRPLPELHAVLLNEESVTLLLGTDDPDPIAPFTATDSRRWTLTGAPSSDDDLDDPVDPYPALVSVGVAHGAVVLVNLEAAGTLHLHGPVDEIREVAQAMAVELGTSALCSTAELVLTGVTPSTARLADAGRTRVLAADAAARWASGRKRAISAALRDGGQTDLADARARKLASDLWSPAVVVEIAANDASDTTLAGGRYCGLSVITTARPAVPCAWTLTGAGGTWRLDPLGIDLSPQRLPTSTLDNIDGLLDLGHPAASPTEGSAPSIDPRAPELSQAMRVTVTPVTATSSGPADLAAIANAIPAPPRAEPRSRSHDDVEPELVLPRVLVLGPVEVVGAVDEGAPNRRRRAVELISYLALHPGASQHQVDEALWPGHRVSANTRNPLVSRARAWLGEKSPDQPYLAHVGNGGQYTLHPDVSCDWHEFCELSRRGVQAGAAGIDDLIGALELVRGRPFLGINPATYGWAETDIQDMVSAIVDVAQTLAERAGAAGDHQRARWAAARGLAAEPFAERLHMLAAEAAAAMGDREESDRIIAALRRQLHDLDPDDDMDLRMAVIR